MLTDQLADESPPERAISTVVVVRQPIVDRRKSVVAHELRYRPLTPSDRLADPETTIASTIVAGLAEVGLSRLVGDRPAHIKVTPQFLHYAGHLPLPPQQVTLELVGGSGADAALLQVGRALIEDGFQIAVVGLVPPGAGDDLLGLASAVKLDARVLALAGGRASDLLDRFRSRDVRLIAERVDTRAHYTLARELGFEAFQGHHFASPAAVSAATAPTHRLGALTSLIQSGSDSTFEDLEQLIAEDAGLSYRFLRLANSAFIGARSPVGSIRQALVRLGSTEVRRWITLLLLSELTDQPQQLLSTSLQRARLCEVLAHDDPAARPERAFTAGLLSILDALLGRPLDELLTELPIDERLRAAILERSGPEGRLLAAVLAYERADFDTCARQGISLRAIAGAYRDAVPWADDTTAALA